MRRQLATLAGLAVIGGLVIPAAATGGKKHHKEITLEFIGEATFPTGFMYQGTEVGGLSGIDYDWKTQSLISAGGLSGVLNVLLATLEPDDEVLLTDPIYVGLINRVRLAGGVPRYVPLIPSADGWRLDLD